MQIKVIKSGSKGDCYLINNEYNETLVVEAGVSFSELESNMGFDIGSIVGCVVTHEHKDHSKYAYDYAKKMIDVYASKGTFSCICRTSPFFHKMTANNKYSIGHFVVITYKSIHDAKEPLMFVIRCGGKNILFATDTCMIPYKFKGLCMAMVECNHDAETLSANYEKNADLRPLYERISNNHLDYDTCIEAIRFMALNGLKKVLLLHKSSKNSGFDYAKSMSAELKEYGLDIKEANKDFVCEI